MRIRIAIASRAFRAFSLCLGIAMIVLLGNPAMLINPMTIVAFWLSLYFACAGIMLIAYFFTKQVRHLLFGLPAMLFMSGVLLFWSFTRLLHALV